MYRSRCSIAFMFLSTLQHRNDGSFQLIYRYIFYYENIGIFIQLNSCLAVIVYVNVLGSAKKVPPRVIQADKVAGGTKQTTEFARLAKNKMFDVPLYK